MKAFKIYKDGADYKYDYLCMYRMHRIYLTDYEYFKVKKNGDLHRLYLYKCFAYLPSLIVDRTYLILNKINVTYELALLMDNDDDGYDKLFDEFMNFLEIHYYKFNLTFNDVKLMRIFFRRFFEQVNTHKIENDINCIDCFLEFEKGDKAYLEAKLK